jgi:hypothetical protein
METTLTKRVPQNRNYLLCENIIIIIIIILGGGGGGSSSSSSVKITEYSVMQPPIPGSVTCTPT